MTGDQLMAVVIFGLTVLGVLSGAFWRMWGLIDKAGQEGKEAKYELAAHKLHVAEVYATKSGVTEQNAQVTKLIADFGERIDKRLDTMTDRLDRVIEANHKPTRRQG